MNAEQDVPQAAQLPPEHRRIQLIPEEFWRLRAVIRDLDALELEFMRIREQFESRRQDAAKRRDDFLAELRTKYGIAEAASYRLRDDSCTLEEE